MDADFLTHLFVTKNEDNIFKYHLKCIRASNSKV